jgi:hypothetical protein
VFHIQTEDSGVNRPHISTHLFADGGRILRSERTDYSDIIGAEDFVAQLRKRMKEQHRAMFVALRDGHFDEVIDTLPADETSQLAVKTARTSKKPGRRPSRRARRSSSRPPKSSRPRAKQSSHPRVDAGARAKTPKPPVAARPSATSGGSHGAVRPAAAAGGGGSSLFGSSIREQSLDDVILSYISDDLEGE